MQRLRAWTDTDGQDPTDLFLSVTLLGSEEACVPFAMELALTCPEATF
ncbi:MAG: hypothetical protein H6732_16825 [Alphaproteobacteria bacterium]|nr:hypothetical protein [Alphaproteobacteria bacterium]